MLNIYSQISVLIMLDLTMFIQAHKAGIRYPTHVIMYPAWYRADWYNNSFDEDSTVNCTVEERVSVLEYSLGVQTFEFIEDYDAVADTGIVSATAVQFSAGVLNDQSCILLYQFF